MMPPSRSFQAALPFCRAFSHLSRLLPSNRTRAPSGGVTLLTSTLSSGLANFRSPMSPYGSSAQLAAEKMTRTTDDRIENRIVGLRYWIVDSSRLAFAVDAGRAYKKAGKAELFPLPEIVVPNPFSYHCRRNRKVFRCGSPWPETS